MCLESEHTGLQPETTEPTKTSQTLADQTERIKQVGEMTEKYKQYKQKEYDNLVSKNISYISGMQANTL